MCQPPVKIKTDSGIGADELYCEWYRCPICGWAIGDGFKYCPNCGVGIEWIEVSYELDDEDRAQLAMVRERLAKI
ncbi:TFIIB-type zinc finger domain-containing protein [Neptuniibacter sp.]|uniref:TFIIB-type zinc finger domain-containing protein n=1 Tax=Neptuniibacter sp. TaxID=1962643 RepID=UPI0026153DD1|nr:TFIIB-type zinc finger domain-containing protein [Neptuniibacter sp.]MCP4597017.1 zinc ribbon domain-containing protein [Neptuniibacter sp.]